MKATITTHNLAREERGASQDACAGLLWRESLIALLADGVGDAEHGGAAARRAVDSLLTNFKSRPVAWPMPRALDEFTRLLNRTLHQESLARFERAELLTTLVVAAVEGARLSGLNLGDSRAYLFRSGELRRLSVDHVADDQELRHVLTRAAGMTADTSPHLFECEVRPGDRLLLCSDGVSGVLPDAVLRDLLAQGATARTIVATAREQATEENLDDASAVVVTLDELTPGRDTLAQLQIPERLSAGLVFEGCRLVRPFNQNERTWFANRAGAQVVLKFPPLEALHNDGIRQQFVREIWSLTRLQAEYFTRAFVPEGGTTLCYCMEYIKAPTLKDSLARDGLLAVAEGVALANFLLDACQFLLGFDLVHGDLKPENILVLARGGEPRFKLIDFGSISEVFSVTSRAGTPSYLAPERFTGSPISERTEVFALGVTLYQAFTGQLPFGEIEPFQTPGFREPKPPSRFNAHLPPWLDALLLRALAVAPDERQQSYSELKFGLAHPAQVKPYFRRDAPLLERNPLLFYQVSCGLLLLLSAILLLLLAK